ncbi:MAG: hypothetical protein U5L11_09675 [Arhodomonas sp.]|nr:hypothetical protein [Arhodomonas sp.]
MYSALKQQGERLYKLAREGDRGGAHARDASPSTSSTVVDVRGDARATSSVALFQGNLRAHAGGGPRRGPGLRRPREPPCAAPRSARSPRCARMVTHGRAVEPRGRGRAARRSMGCCCPWRRRSRTGRMCGCGDDAAFYLRQGQAGVGAQGPGRGLGRGSSPAMRFVGMGDGARRRAGRAQTADRGRLAAPRR